MSPAPPIAVRMRLSQEHARGTVASRDVGGGATFMRILSKPG